MPRNIAIVALVSSAPRNPNPSDKCCQAYCLPSVQGAVSPFLDYRKARRLLCSRRAWLMLLLLSHKNWNGTTSIWGLLFKLGYITIFKCAFGDIFPCFWKTEAVNSPSAAPYVSRSVPAVNYFIGESADALEEFFLPTLSVPDARGRFRQLQLFRSVTTLAILWLEREFSLVKPVPLGSKCFKRTYVSKSPNNTS